jgi:hypothetical protein
MKTVATTTPARKIASSDVEVVAALLRYRHGLPIKAKLPNGQVNQPGRVLLAGYHHILTNEIRHYTVNTGASEERQRVEIYHFENRVACPRWAKASTRLLRLPVRVRNPDRDP